MGPSSQPPRPSSPPRFVRPRRPWYLNAALIVAWLIGGGTVIATSFTLSQFRTTPGEISLDVDREQNLTEGERASQKVALGAYTDALHAAQRRIFPLTLAELLIGAGMVVFSQRATLGRAWARHALVQLTIAHVALSGLTWALTPDLRGPESNLQMVLYKLDPADVDARVLKVANVGGLAIGALIGALTVLGLTLRGSRAFYEATPDLVER